jgi:hypothetical protein
MIYLIKGLLDKNLILKMIDMIENRNSTGKIGRTDINMLIGSILVSITTGKRDIGATHLMITIKRSATSQGMIEETSSLSMKETSSLNTKENTDIILQTIEEDLNKLN